MTLLVRSLSSLRWLNHQLAGERMAPRWRLHRPMAERAAMVVQAYYAVSLFMLYDRSREIARLDGRAGDLDPLWPIAWLDWVGADLGGMLMAHLAIVGGLGGLLFWRRLWARVLVSLALLQFVALNNSFGFMGHGYHSWFWMSVALWFLPNGRPPSGSRGRFHTIRFLLGFSVAPALMLLFYSLSGLYKAVFAISALFTEDISGLAPQAMALTLAWRIFETNAEPLWAHLVIGQPWLGWPLYLGLYYAELFAFMVFFRPRLHRLWGLILILFHIGTFLFMDITFPEHVLICALFLFMSPFEAGLHGYGRALAALPLFGPILRAVAASRGAPSSVGRERFLP
ncbi:MAG: hypothetical protein ACFB6S_06710 [Geminicoccaceae bacterium]